MSSSSSSSSSSGGATTTATTTSSSLYAHQMHSNPSTLTTTINIINTNTHAAAASQLKLQQLKSTQYGNYLTLNQQQHNQTHTNNNFALNSSNSRTFHSNENGNSVTNALVKHESFSIVKNEPNETKSINENNTNNSSNNNFSLDVYVNNVVCSYSTKCHLNLRKIATEGMHVEYKRENGMVNMRLRKPHTTATIWPSGKITCAGARSESDAYKAARRFCRLLQKMQFRVKLNNYRVVNVLATCTMPFSIDIIRIANKFQKECSYEPELHPGATFKLSDLKTTLKLFTTGSVTLTAPSVSVAQQAVNRMYPILYEYRRNAPPQSTLPSSLTTTSNSNHNHIQNVQVPIKTEQQSQHFPLQHQSNSSTSNASSFFNSQAPTTANTNIYENGLNGSSLVNINNNTNNHSLFNNHGYFNNDISLTPHLLYETFSSSSLSSNSNLQQQSHPNLNSNHFLASHSSSSSSSYNLNSPNSLSSATNSSSSTSSLSTHNWYLGSNTAYCGDQGLISIDHVDDFLP